MDELGGIIETCSLSKKVEEQKYEDTPVDKLTIICHNTQRVIDVLDKRRIEFVPPLKSYPYVDKVLVNWIGPNKPAILKVNNLGDITDTGAFVLDLTFDTKTDVGNEKDNNLMKFLKSIITYNNYKDYTITNVPKGFSPINLRLYNPERWGLIIGIPPLKKFSGGAKLEQVGVKEPKLEYSSERKVESNTFGNTYSAGNKQSTSISSSNNNQPTAHTTIIKKTESEISIKERETSSSSGIAVSINKESFFSKNPSNKAYIKLFRNASPEKVDILTTVNNILAIGNMVKQVLDGIKDNVPKVGFYFDYNLEIFSGEIKLGWGWAECTDKRAYYQLFVDSRINILKASIEFGFGISVVAFKAQIFAQGSGRIGLDHSWESKPDATTDDYSVEFNINGGINLCIGVRFDVLFILKVELTINSGIEIPGVFEYSPRLERGFQFSFSPVFTGIYVNLSAGVGHAGAYATKKNRKQAEKTQSKLEKLSKNGPIILYPEKKLAEWVFPKAEEKKPGKPITPKELQDVFKKMLNGTLEDEKKDKIRIRRRKNFLIFHPTEKVDIEEIAVKLQQKVNGRKIDLNNNAVGLLMHTIRQRFERFQVYKTLLGIHYIEEEDVLDFIDGDEYEELLLSFEDPVLTMIEEMKR